MCRSSDGELPRLDHETAAEMLSGMASSVDAAAVFFQIMASGTINVAHASSPKGVITAGQRALGDAPRPMLTVQRRPYLDATRHIGALHGLKHLSGDQMAWHGAKYKASKRAEYVVGS